MVASGDGGSQAIVADGVQAATGIDTGNGVTNFIARYNVRIKYLLILVLSFLFN